MPANEPSEINGEVAASAADQRPSTGNAVTLRRPSGASHGPAGNGSLVKVFAAGHGGWGVDLDQVLVGQAGDGHARYATGPGDRQSHIRTDVYLRVATLRAARIRPRPGVLPGRR